MAHLAGSIKETQYLTTMTAVLEEESIEGWLQNHVPRSPISIFPRILPDRAPVSFLRKIQELDAPDHRITLNEWATIIAYYGQALDPECLTALWQISHEGSDILLHRCMIFLVCSEFRTISSICHPLFVLRCILEASEIDDWKDDLALKHIVRELVAVPRYRAPECYAEDQELATWILEEDPIQDDEASWKLISALRYPDRSLATLIRHSHSLGSPIQLWIGRTPSTKSTTEGSRYQITYPEGCPGETYAEGCPGETYPEGCPGGTYTILSSTTPLACATGPCLRIKETYLYLQNRLLEIRNSKPYPTFWLRNIFSSSIPPICLPHSTDSGLHLVHYGAQLQKKVLMYLPSLIIRILNKPVPK